MRHPVLLIAALALAAPLGVPFGAPAQASEPAGVLLSYDRYLVPFDAGYEVVVNCNASADPGDFTDIPVATVVTCSVNGMSANRGNPGREAFVQVNATVTGSYTVCISGSAAFVDPVGNEIETPSAGPVCQTWPAVLG